MALRKISLLWALGAVACAHGDAAGRRGADAAHLPAADAASMPLGAVDGAPLLAGQLSAETALALARLDETYALRRFTLMWTGTEDLIAARLLAREAARQGVDVATLLTAEVDRKVGTPSPEEVRALYDAHAQIIGQPFEAAAEELTRRWHDDQVLELKRALVDRLRADAQITYDLVPPLMPRREVSPGPLTPLGPADAKVTVVTFGDYACPYTAQARRLMTRVLALYPKDVRWVWRDFPIDLDSASHPAAEGAACADEQHQFWAFHARLFERASPTTSADLPRVAMDVGLDLAAFRDCMASPRPKLTVAQSQRDGQRLGVSATPTFFVNGLPVDSVLPLAALRAFIDRELAAHAGR